MKFSKCCMFQLPGLVGVMEVDCKLLQSSAKIQNVLLHAVLIKRKGVELTKLKQNQHHKRNELRWFEFSFIFRMSWQLFSDLCWRNDDNWSVMKLMQITDVFPIIQR